MSYICTKNLAYPTDLPADPLLDTIFYLNY